MKRTFVVAILLAMMLAVRALKADAPALHDPLTLAAIGFVVLAAFTIAELGSALTLPRVTGYIVAGVVLGPSVGNILSKQVVSEMRMFNTLALGLIATAAGLELDLGQIRRVGRTLVATTAAKLVLAVTLVGGTFLAVQAFFAPLALTEPHQIWTMALAMGVLAVGTSPSVTLAILSETKAKGRLSDLVLGAAVLKDLVVVVSLAVVVAVSRILLVPGSALDAAIFVEVGKELAGSIGAGAVLGTLLVLYMRFVRAEMLLFVAAMILVVAELSRALHLELLLVFIAAGFFVRNFSKQEHALSDAVATVSLPVFVVFFTIAGASVDLRGTLAIVPLAISLSLARAVAFFAAARFGGAIGNEAPAIRQSAWLGYLPLAGVTLGLVGLTSQRIEQLSAPILTTGTTLVAINLLIGPITQRRALQLAGEVRQQARRAHAARKSVGQPSTSLPPPSTDDLTTIDAAAELGKVTRRLESEELVVLVQELFDQLHAESSAFYARELVPWIEAVKRSAIAAIEAPESLTSEDLRALVERGAEAEVEARAEACRRLFSALRLRLRRLPDMLVVPLEPANRRIQPGDPSSVRWKKRFFWLTLRRERRIPVRLLAAVCLDVPVAAIAAQTLAAWCRGHADLLEVLRTALGARDAAAARDAIGRAVDHLEQRFHHDAAHALVSGIVPFADGLGRVDGPLMPVSEVRYSPVEHRVDSARARLDSEAARWAARLRATQGSVRVLIELARVEVGVRQAVERFVLSPLETACSDLDPILSATGERFAEARKDCETAPSHAQLRSIVEACRAALSTATDRRLQIVARRFRASTSIHAVSIELRRIVEALPDRLEVALTAPGADPWDVPLRTVYLRELADRHLLRDVQPAIDEHIRASASLAGSAGRRIVEAIDLVAKAEAAASNEESSSDGARSVAQALDQAITEISKLTDATRTAGSSIRKDVEQRMSDAFAAIKAVTTAADGAEGDAIEHRVGRWLAWSTTAAASIRERIRRASRSTMNALRRLGFGGFETEGAEKARGEQRVADASELRTLAERWHVDIDLPESYAMLFRLEPVREHRLFTANKQVLKAVVDAERTWLQGGPSSALVIGDHGSGRTSVVNLCELELSSSRVVRPDPERSRPDLGILAALAYELECDAHEVEAALHLARTSVLIDDLEQWFAPTAAGLEELERFLKVVVRTHGSVFWVVTVGDAALSVYEEALPLRAAFGRAVTLPPLSAEAMREALEERHAQSERALEYPRTLATRLFGRVDRDSDRAAFYRAFVAATAGNLSSAMTLWCKFVRVNDQGGVTVGFDAANLPHFAAGSLSEREVAALAQLLRFGPMRIERLAESLALRSDEADRHASFLVASGLVEPTGNETSRLQIPARLQAPIEQALRAAGAWGVEA